MGSSGVLQRDYLAGPGKAGTAGAQAATAEDRTRACVPWPLAATPPLLCLVVLHCQSTHLAPLKKSPITGPKAPWRKRRDFTHLSEPTDDPPFLSAASSTLSHFGAGVWADNDIFLGLPNENLAILSNVTHRVTAVGPYPRRKVETCSALYPKA